MSDWYDYQKKPKFDWRKALQERIEANTPTQRELTAYRTEAVQLLMDAV